jgi:uncharacterized membrane protein YbhN (UPF0104 family)
MDTSLQPQPKSNPLLTIWLHPRRTISRRIAITPDPMVYLLAGLSGISTAFYRAVEHSSGDDASLERIVLGFVVSGVIGGIITMALVGFLCRATGKWIGGKASYRKIKTAYAWATVPAIVSLVFYVPMIAIYGNEIFSTYRPTIEENSLPLRVVDFCRFGLNLWAFILFWLCLSEVQEFSVWKALGNIAIAFLVVMIIVLIFILISFGPVFWTAF